MKRTQALLFSDDGDGGGNQLFPDEIVLQIMLSQNDNYQIIENIKDYQRLLSTMKLNKTFLSATKSILINKVTYISGDVLEKLSDATVNGFKNLKKITLPVLTPSM